MKKIIRFLRAKSEFIDEFFFKIAFVRKNKYIPNFKKPRTFNEKINFRKKQSTNPLFSQCSDKILVKEWVKKLGFENIIIETLFTTRNLEVNQLKKLLSDHGDLLVKANHNSGPVFMLTTDSTACEIETVCKNIKQQLSIDYGKLKRESWYSQITPEVLVEKRVLPEAGEKELKDYKFHIFKQPDGSAEVILHVDFERSENHNRTIFDDKLSPLQFSIEYPTIKKSIVKPKNYDEMLKIAKILAEPFSYVRVDLYNVNGKIYFGELTFAHGSGAEKITPSQYDFWMGSLWSTDPSN